MTVHALSAGEGYRYYLRSIIVADGERRGRRPLRRDAQAAGTPPGRWMGSAAARLGLSGQVDEEQMRSLYGLGMHPRARDIVAEEREAGRTEKQAFAAAKLGPAIPNLSPDSPLDRTIAAALEEAEADKGEPLTGRERTAVRMRCAADAFRTAYGREADTGEELGRFLAARTGPQRQPRTGFDLVFRNKGASVLWALGDEHVRGQCEAAHQQAVAEALAWIEDNALAVRTGAGGIAQQPAVGGAIASRFTHFDSRTGDPLLHDHVVLSSRVMGPDGRWRNLDGTLLYRQAVTASELYNRRVMEEVCARLGLRTYPRQVTPGRRPVMAIAGIPEELIRLFSRRDAATMARLEELLTDYRSRTGRHPDNATRMAMMRRAAEETRPAKKRARPLKQLRRTWRERAVAAVGADTVDQLLEHARAAADAMNPPEPVDVVAAAAEVLAEVEAHRATFHRRHVAAEAERYLARTLTGATAPAGLADAITDHVLAAGGDCLDITPPEINPPHPELQRADGTSIYRPIGSNTYTTGRTLAAEDQLLAAARTLAIPPLTARFFDRVARRHAGPLDPAQRALARAFCCSERVLAAGIGPAGSGKTTAMKLAADALDGAGQRLIPLAPSARAAKVLGQELDRPAHTLHSWLYRRDKAARGEWVDERFALGPGDIVLVDEAAMAGTRMLQRITADAEAAGAHVRLLGDPAQLAAVEAGGILRLLARQHGAIELTHLHRFATPGEADASLELRDGTHPGQAFAWYRTGGRITGGSEAAMLDAVFAAWQHDTSRGLTSVMTAPDNATVTALNARAQIWRAAAGHLDLGHRRRLIDRILHPRRRARRRRLRDELIAHPGDLIVTRRNDYRLPVRGGRDFVKNGDTWHIERITRGGDLIVRHSEHHGRIQLPATYVDAHVELGYAATVHRAQGLTCDTSHGLVSDTSTRESAYVQLTRGRRTNHLYVVLEDGQDLDRRLTRLATRRSASLTATEHLALLQDELTGPARLAAEYADVTERATTARLAHLMRDVLGDRAHAFLAADAWPALARTLTTAEAAGFDLARLLPDAVWQRGLADADDVAAVLTWRLKNLLGHAENIPADRPLADLTRTQLENLAHQARTHQAAALSELHAAEAAVASQPRPVTARGTLHPAWPERPHGPLTRTQLSHAIHAARITARDAERRGDRLLLRAAHVHLSELTDEHRLRRTLPWREKAREDWQREPGPLAPRTATQPLETTRRAPEANSQRQAAARTAHARATTTTDKINAELRLRDHLPDQPPHTPDHTGAVPDWLADRTALHHPNTPRHWRDHLHMRRRILSHSLDERGRHLATTPPAWSRPLGPPPATTQRGLWENTAALIELWRARHATPPTTEGLGPRPEDPEEHAAYDDLTARIRALHPAAAAPPPHHPPHTTASAGSDDDRMHLAGTALDATGTPQPDHPALRPALGQAPANWTTLHAEFAAHALRTVLATGTNIDSWLDHLPTPDEDDEDEQHTWKRLAARLDDWRRRHHRAGHDPLGPRTEVEHDPDAATEWDHLTDAIAGYQRARIEHRLVDLRARLDHARTTGTGHAARPDHPSPQPPTVRRPPAR